MIAVVQKERRYDTPWCTACTMSLGPIVEGDDTCNYCLGFLVTYHLCPGCSAVGHFYGYDNPEKCEKCETEFPDLEKIKENLDERIKYHLGNILL